METKDGTDTAKTYREGYHGGLWQVDENFFLQPKSTSAYPILLEKYELIKSAFDIDWSTVKWEDLRTPLHCGIAAWLYMFTRDDPIPLSIEDQADHWKKNYRENEPDLGSESFVTAVTIDLEKMKEGNSVASGMR